MLFRSQEAQNKLNASKEQLNEVEEDLSGLTATQKTLKKSLNQLQNDLQIIVGALSVLEEELQIKKEEIEITLGKLEEAQEDEKKQYEAMKSRIKFVYERGDIAYIDLLLSARTFSDFLNKTDYVEKLSKYDRGMLVEYQEIVEKIAHNFLAATQQASEIYEHLKKEKGEGKFITEVSMDEVENPQTPLEMLFILKMLADKGVPAQTIAPKFTGRFNKGVDYVGNLDQFSKEFEEDLMVIDFAVKEFGLDRKSVV